VFLPKKVLVLLLFGLFAFFCRNDELEEANSRSFMSYIKSMVSFSLSPNPTQTSNLVPSSNLIPPSNLSYSSQNLILSFGTPMVAINPTFTGTVTSYSVSPSLPGGITLNTSSGQISGTPTTVKSSTYFTITASNSAGSTNNTVNITISYDPKLAVSLSNGLIKTGQSTSYVSGDDKTYQIGIERTFTPGGTNGLIWQRCSAGQETSSGNCGGTATTYTWDQAKSYCSGLNLLGQTWRLPTVFELTDLVDFGKNVAPTIDTTAFPNTQSSEYWSSNEDVQYSIDAFHIHFGYGYVWTGAKTNSYYVRCVTGTSQLRSKYTDNGNGTVSDSSTGLVWQKCSYGQDPTTCSGAANTPAWSGSISYCEGLTLGGRSDWRLPNVNELRSIVDNSKLTAPTIDTTVFPNTQTANYWYWTSTTYSFITTSAWHVDFNGGGYVYSGDKPSATLYVRCVTGP
jgi:hypothetical protein